MDLFGSKVTNFLIFSQKNVFLIFQETELYRPKIKKFLILSGLSPKNVFPEKEILIVFPKKNLLWKNFLSSFKKRFFLYFEKWNFLAV